MKNLLLLFLTFAFHAICPEEVQSQTLQPNYGAPVNPISVCDGNAGFKVKIIGSSNPCAQGTLSIVLPAGYFFVNGSAVVSAGSGTVSQLSYSANTASLNVQSIPASPDSTVISFQAYADCSAIGTATASNNQVKYTLNSVCLGTYTVTSNSFNTQSAALSLSPISNQNYNGAIGDLYSRNITVANNGLGTISQITLKDTSGNGYFISGFTVNNGWSITKTSTVSGTDTIFTLLLSGPKLAQGTSIVVTENVKLVSKCYLQSKWSAYFGCNGQVCTNNNVNAYTTGSATVNSSLSPNLKIVATMNPLACRGQLYPQAVSLINNGGAPMYNLKLNLFSCTWSAVAGTQYFNPARSFTSGGQSAFQNIQYKIGAKGVLAALPLDSSKVFTSPGASIVGMPACLYATIPLLKAGDTVFLSYNELNSPLPGINNGNTMEMSGNELWYSYGDACGNSTAPVATFLRAYQQIRINTSPTLPANMQTGQSYTFSYNFFESNTGIYINSGAGGSTIRFDLVLPNNIDFSGNAADVMLKNNGLPYGTATGFSYNAVTHTVSVTYPVNGSFTINGMLGATLSFSGLTLNCAAIPNGNNVYLNCYLKNLSACSNTEQFFSLPTKVGFICPVSCGSAGGLSLNNFTLRRTNYGLPDNNDDGVADAAGVIDFNKVKTNYAMQGDTLEAAFFGTISLGAGSPVGGFKYGYAVDTFSAYNTSISNLFATVQLFAAGSSIPFYSCNNVPVLGGTTNTRKVDFSISALNAIGGCGLPGGYTSYNNGDSVVVKIYYRVSNNIGGTIAPVTLNNKFLVSAVANPAVAQQYSCGGVYTGALQLVGIGFGGNGNLTYNINGVVTAGTQATIVADVGPCCVASGSKPFDYEYRSITIYDSMSYTLPPGYDFVSATVAYSYTKGPSLSAGKTVPIVPVNPGASVLVFNIRALFENGTLPYGDQGSSMVPTVTIRPNCAAPPKATAYYYIREIATPGSNSGLSSYVMAISDTLYYNAANINLTATNPSVSTNTNTVSWDFQISNASTSTAGNVWMAKDTGVSGVTITSIQKLTGPNGAVVSTLTATAGGIYQLGNFAQVSNYYRINATYTNCTKDSMNLAYWFDCNATGYPANVSSAVFKKDISLSVIPQPAALQTSIFLQPDPAISNNFCDTLKYMLDTYNAGPGSVYNLSITTVVPVSGGVNFASGSLAFQYPAGSGAFVSIPDSWVSYNGSNMVLDIPPALLPKLDATQSVRLKFGLQTGCSFVSGQSFKFSPGANLACGKIISGIAQQSGKINIIGVPANTNIYGISSFADTAAQACVSTGAIQSAYRFKIINQGPLSTSTSDGFSISLPAPWQLDTNAIVYTHNPGAAAYTRYASGVYYFTTGGGVAVGDSVTLNANLFVAAPAAASIPVGNSAPIVESALVFFTGICSGTGIPCPAQSAIVSDNQTTIIPVAHPQYSIQGFSLQQSTSKDTSISGTLSIIRAASLYTPQNLTINLYKDINGNNVVDGADLLLGQQTFPVANTPGQTIAFNINSLYTGALCPTVIARIDFGCYNVSYVYACGSTSTLYSNAGAVKSIEQCNNSSFNLSAIDAAGKWVVDSGTAIVNSRYFPATTVTVNPGTKVRLLWFGLAPGNTGGITVYPDTIRLTNNALPVVSALKDTSVCAGDSIGFFVTASVLNGVPTYQWYKNGTIIAGANTHTLVINKTVLAADAGLYSVTVTGNGGCATSTAANLIVNALPTATIAYSGSPYCATGTASVTQTGQAAGTYTAPGGLVINATSGAIDLVASTPGTYIVTYSFSNGTCNNTTTASVTINALPTATIAYSGSPYCATGTASVTQTGQAAGTYTAPGGLVINATTGAIDLVASTPGTYIVTYSFSNGTCNNTTTASVTINALPTATIAYSGSPYCATGTASVTQTGQAGGTFSSSAGLFVNAATGAVDLVNSAAGTYTVFYTFSNGNCSNSTNTTITINALPTATIAYSGSPYCGSGTASVTVTGQAGGTFTSSAGLFINAATGAIDLTNSAPGTYTVFYAFSNGTCNNTSKTTVTINPLPALSVHNPAAVCAPATVDITATAVTAGTTGASAFAYWTDAAASIALTKPNAIAISGTYYITASSPAGCISPAAAVTVTINPKPLLSVNGTPEICKGSADTLYAVSPGNNINWSTGEVSSSIVINPAVSTNYSVTAATAAGCFNTASITVTVDDFKMDLSANPNPVLAGTNIVLSSSANFSYNVTAWAPQAYFNNQTVKSQSFIITDSSVVFYAVGANAIGCVDTAYINVTVQPNTKDFFIPNAFTPNNDGNNDIFKVYGSSVKELHLIIVNQWGQTVFETNTPGKGWDGNVNGHAQPAGAYVYALKATLYNGAVIQKRGTVNLVR